MVLCDSDLGELLTTVAKCFQQQMLFINGHIDRIERDDGGR